MCCRAWRIVVIISLLWASQSAIAEPHAESNAPAVASMGLPDTTADRVLGQAAFNTNGSGTSATAMNGPAGIAIAPPGAPNADRLFVVEYGNHRVLSWPSAASFATGQAADLVIGQANFASGSGALGQDRFYGPEAAVVDSSGRLWVADTENNRVLRFDPPFSNGMNASVVLGQPNYLSNDINQGGSVAANTLYYPRGLAIDAAGNLYVADDDNNRVLRFAPPFTNNMNASLVIGQANFTSGSPNRGGAAGQNTLNSPKGIAVDGSGNLYVAEYDNHRVTRYAPPLSNGKNVSSVFGQPNFASDTANNGGIGPGSLYHPVDIAVSAAGNKLFVTDQGNVRVLGCANPLGDAVADQVYGQPTFTSSTPNPGGVPSATSLNTEPLGVAVDANGSLYHADFQNHRLLAYNMQQVGDGTPGSCTEAGLNGALAGGGMITFNCGTALINLSSTKSINANTTIDGGGKITLSGQNARQLFIVNNGAILTLRNIVLTDGFSSGDGGAIYNQLGGGLTIENSTIRNSRAAASGGAIVSYGPLLITYSLLEGNQALNGGALYPRWPGAETVVVGSVLRNNRATDTTDGWGGAILAWDGAPVTIEGSDIEGNSAHDGGGIYNFANSVLLLKSNTRLRDNRATSAGGGVYNDGIATLANVNLGGNSGFYGGGLYNNSTANLIDTTFSGNSATSGGGLYNNNGTATLTNVTISGNSADRAGGLLNDDATATLTNVTLSGNSAVDEGGGLLNYGSATLTNVTLSGNSAGSQGGGIYHRSFSTANILSLKNTIVANSPSGGNCYNYPGSATTIASGGYNISSDNTCALPATGDRNGVNPLLTALGNYGGPTPVHMLKPGSPALDGVLGSDAPATDQRGVARPQGGGYDIGAVERRSNDSSLAPRVYLPVGFR